MFVIVPLKGNDKLKEKIVHSRNTPSVQLKEVQVIAKYSVVDGHIILYITLRCIIFCCSTVIFCLSCFSLHPVTGVFTFLFTFGLQLLIMVQLLKVKQIWGTMTLTHCKRLHFLCLFFFLITWRLCLIK